MFCFVTHICESSTAPFFPFCVWNLNTKKPKCKYSSIPDVHKNTPLLIIETPFVERRKLGSKVLFLGLNAEYVNSIFYNSCVDCLVSWRALSVAIAGIQVYRLFIRNSQRPGLRNWHLKKTVQLSQPHLYVDWRVVPAKAGGKGALCSILTVEIRPVAQICASYDRNHCL